MIQYAYSTADRDRRDWQTLREHLEGVAILAAASAAKFEVGEWGQLCGLLHNLGRYAPAFQARLAGGERVDHATAGAIEAERYGLLARAIQFVVAGHDAGLADGLGGAWVRKRTPLWERLRQADPKAHAPGGGGGSGPRDGRTRADHPERRLAALPPADAGGVDGFTRLA